MATFRETLLPWWKNISQNVAWLNLLVHVNALNYEHWTDKQKYFYAEENGTQWNISSKSTQQKWKEADYIIQPVFTCSKPTMETPEQRVKSG